MHLQAILDKLYALHRFGIKPGLERTLRLLECVGNPHHDLRCIHVAGTNGKGSISSICASILKESGLRVALYTSPHIQRFNERIVVDGNMISDSELVELYQEIAPHADALSATFFEVTTVMAFLYFNRMQTDVCVIECGMGGRFDSTNVITPLVSVISSVDLDHEEYLGSTLEDICIEKCGIIKPSIAIVAGEQREALQALIKKTADDLHCKYVYGPDHVLVVEQGVDEYLHARVDIQSLLIKIHDATFPLSGAHQRRNLACALSALELLPTKLQPSTDAVLRGLQTLQENSGLQGRIQVLSVEPVVIIDVGHNPACMHELVRTLKNSMYADQRFNVVFGAMVDKNIEEMLGILQSLSAKIFAVQPHIARSQSSTIVAAKAEDLGIPALDCSDVAKGAELALQSGGATLVCGSFYLIEEALPVIERHLQNQLLRSS